MAKGAEALTNAELLAILIGGGTTKKSAVELMQEVLHDCGDTLRGLNHMTLHDLLRYNGIGEAKALTIIAAAEIGKRRMMEDSRQIPQMRTGADVLKFMSPIIQDLNHEESWAMLLNNNARILHLSHLSTGGLAETTVDVRMLLKEALLHDATCFILVHNHPSGNMRPSRYDEELTQRLNRAAQAINLRMIDHVIVTEGEYYSFSENGKL
jgi:DNA repair protein RadC